MFKLSKIILTLILLCLFIPNIQAQAAGNAIFRLTSARTDYYVGENVYIDVMVEPNGESINTVRLISDFTGTGVLQINDFNLGTAWPNQSPGRELNNTTQHINVGGFILVDSVSTDGKFGTLIFKANAVGTSIINISTGSHLISPDQIERLNLAGSQNITINVLGALPQPNRAPIFDGVSNKSIELGQSVNFHVRSSDPDNDNVTLSTNIPVDASFNNVTSGPIAEGDFSWIPTARGIYTLIFYATDDNSTGSKTGSLTVTVNVSTPVPPANLAPVFQPVGNKAINLGQPVAFHVQATDPNGDKVNLTWNIPAGSIFSNVVNNVSVVSGDFSWTPTSEGVFTVTFTGADDNAIDPKSATLAISIGVSVLPNHAPIFEPLTEKSVNAGETLTFNVSATDPDGDEVALTLEPLENASLASISSGITATSRFSWMPQNFGIYYAVFKAKDNNANSLESTQTVRITVFGGQCPPCGGGGGGTCPICRCEEQKFENPLAKPTPIIASLTHPDQKIWYSNNTPQFTWQVAAENLGYVFNIDQNPNADPTIGYYFSQDKIFSFSQLTDGFWYFHLKVKYLDGFGPTAHYQIKIDTTPPEFFKPNIEGNKVYFSALDKDSGVAYYEMKIDDGSWQKIENPYELNGNDRQGKILSLRAVDNAGNAIEAALDLAKKELIGTEEKKYTINQPELLIAAPLIDLVAYPLIRGRALPGAKVYLILSTEPQSVIYTLADYQGNWLAYIDKKVKPGKYAVFAIANYNNLESAPSEKVYFSISKSKEQIDLKFAFKVSWLWMILAAVLMIAAWTIIHLILRYKNLYLTKKIFRRAYGQGEKDGEVYERIKELKQAIKNVPQKKK